MVDAIHSYIVIFKIHIFLIESLSASIPHASRKNELVRVPILTIKDNKLSFSIP